MSFIRFHLKDTIIVNGLTMYMHYWKQQSKQEHNLGDGAELMHVVFPGKQGLLVIEFHEDATNRPHINCCRVPFCVEEQFRRAIPPRHHVLGHQVRLRERPRQSKVCNLEVALFINQQVARLEIAMQHIRRMDVFQTSEQLV
jgi:hypothetical protein